MVDVDVLGFGNDKGDVFGIPSKERIHVAIFGEVGSGKSETLKLLIYQNICKEQGFLLVDPHGMLARSVLELIPRKDWEKVVFISPVTIRQNGRVVRINPLESKNKEDRYLVSMSFVNSLRNLYKDSWGDRLEAVLRNACNTIVEIPGSTIRDLQRIVTDRESRQFFLQKVSNSDTISFWENTFEQYSKEAGSAVYNKLDKMLATPPVAAILDSPTSGIDFGDALKDNKFIIVDLSSGASDDITSFLGSIILHMVYVEAKKRVDKTEQLDTPFFLYVDEAHLFSAFALREILNTMRKFNVKVTLATQTINAYPKKVADEITALARTIVCFRCDANTANMFKDVLPSRDLDCMLLHRFAFYSQGASSMAGVAKTIPLNKKVADWKEVAKYSTQNYGEPVSLGLMSDAVRDNNGVFPDLTPCESCILLLLQESLVEDFVYEKRVMTSDEIFTELCRRFGFFDVTGGISKRIVYDSIESLIRYHDLNRHIVRIDDLKTKKRLTVQKFSLSKTAYRTHLSTTAVGKRAGSMLHLAAIFVLVKILQKQLKYCIIDLGDKGGKRPDILVFEPFVQRKKSIKKYDVLSYDLTRWSNDIKAIEVETDPARNPSQVVTNYIKNFEVGFDVWFVVFSDDHKNTLKTILKKSGIEKSYDVIVLQADNVLNSYEKICHQDEVFDLKYVRKLVDNNYLESEKHQLLGECSVVGPPLIRNILEYLKT